MKKAIEVARKFCSMVDAMGKLPFAMASYDMEKEAVCRYIVRLASVVAEANQAEIDYENSEDDLSGEMQHLMRCEESLREVLDELVEGGGK